VTGLKLCGRLFADLFTELAVRITVQQMLASKTINDLLTDVVLGLSTASLTRLPSSPTPA
jgi:hypothetical protein